MALSRPSSFRNILGKFSSIRQLQNVVGSSAGSRAHHVTPHPLNLREEKYEERTVLRPMYGGRHTVTMLAGDGVGPELMSHVKEVFRYAGVPVDFEEVKCDQTCTDEEFEHAIFAIKRNGVAIKGNVENFHSDPGFQSRNVELRTELDLFANIINVQSIPAIASRHSNIDIVIIRENTEGEYSGLEHEVQHENVGGVVESLKIITERKSTRIAKYAFDYAVAHGRKKVTCVHKANIMKLADGLFLECCQKVSEFYPDIEFEAMIVDNCSMQMVSRPQQFDVMVLPNLYGNIIANIGVGLIGGAGLVPGTNIGNEIAVFEMGTRNTGRNIMGKNIANPTSMLLASTDMLDHLGLHDHAKLVKAAIWKTIEVDKVHTPDIGGEAATTDVIRSIVTNIQDSHKWY